MEVPYSVAIPQSHGLHVSNSFTLNLLFIVYGICGSVVKTQVMLTLTKVPLFIYLISYCLSIYLFLASSQTFTGDTGSFLFTLVNPTGNPSAKLDSNPEGGIRCSSGIGPSFGNASYYDLQIWFNDERGYLDLGYGFRRPESVDKNKYFTGSNGFEITDLEVYEIMF